VKFLWKESELNAKDNISICCEILEKNKIKKVEVKLSNDSDEIIWL
jgi:hypothetical protein